MIATWAEIKFGHVNCPRLKHFGHYDKRRGQQTDKQKDGQSNSARPSRTLAMTMAEMNPSIAVCVCEFIKDRVSENIYK